MTHNEKRSSTMREGQLALLTGSIYGAVHTITGHPLDTIKSKMQLQAKYSNLSAVSTARDMFREFGFRGFFHGCLPPLLGSALYRGVMMSAYEATFTYVELNFERDHPLRTEYFGFVRPVVPVSVTCASFCRGLIEAPFEYAKVMGQTQQEWKVVHMFRGLHWQIMRTTVLLLPIFQAIDYLRRRTDAMKTLAGNFFVTFGVVGASYAVSWPLETMKNLSQSGIPRPNATISERVAYMGGVGGLLRGIYPGALGGGIRNAFGMIAMIFAQKYASTVGLRDK
jgi:solute carrier family 25 (mitochondrial carnitine/acylcarnitine transporter), member 20/29